MVIGELSTLCETYLYSESNSWRKRDSIRYLTKRLAYPNVGYEFEEKMYSYSNKRKNYRKRRFN